MANKYNSYQGNSNEYQMKQHYRGLRDNRIKVLSDYRSDGYTLGEIRRFLAIAEMSYPDGSDIEFLEVLIDKCSAAV